VRGIVSKMFAVAFVSRNGRRNAWETVVL